MSETLYDELYRPQFHFSARKNWLNDPNGLVFYDGEYHLFFQHNPDSVNWGNMTWGHAVSTDLVRWKQLDHALHPDQHGTMFSGSAVVDWNNTAGFQTGREKALVAIYTAHNQPVANEPMTEKQCIAFSNDRGRTWTKYDKNPVIPERKPNHDFRDPKVFWHSPTGRWIMIAFDQPGMSLFASKNLREWEHLSKVQGLPGECPDMYELPEDGNAAQMRWIVEGGNGDYYVGRFDGTTFTPETEKITCDFGGNYYATQTFSDMPASDGRRIQIGWMNGGAYPDMPFNQQMAFPRELTLVTTPAGPRMVRRPVREIATLRGKEQTWKNVELKPGENPLAGLQGDTFEIEAAIAPGAAGKVGLRLRDETIRYSVPDRRLKLMGKYTQLALKDGLLDLHILLDRTSIEIFADGGLVTMASCFLPEACDRGLELYATGGAAKIVSLRVCELKSTWR